MSAPALLRRSSRRLATLAAAADPEPTAAAAKPAAARGRKRAASQGRAPEEAAAAAAPAAAAKRAAAAAQQPKLESDGPSRQFEEELWALGHAMVAGVDEAGRGPLAGPVVAAACIVPPHVTIAGVHDSKRLNEAQREQVYAELTAHAEIVWAACVVSAEEIDRINILQATLKAMEGAAAGLAHRPSFHLVDGNRLPPGFDPACSRAIVKGDARSYCIAAASIIAKVTRDRLMHEVHAQYPQYNFAQHKGYGVREHVAAIREHGPCPQHRRTFAPIKTWFPLETAQGEDKEDNA